MLQPGAESREHTGGKGHSAPPVTEKLALKLGLSAQEYSRILEVVGRVPSFTELGIFSAMWNEHCSYKSSRKWLRKLPVSGDQVIQGPGENAGIVDIGDDQAVVFKMESHNHPSYIEPYQGAATGVGGILRDVFTMGARPIAALNALRFGAPDQQKTRRLLAGAVSGIGGYGNCFGVPTVGGELEFDEAYGGNCLVNAFAAGLVDHSSIFYARVEQVGVPIVYLGAKTGRDGVGGASMASAEFDDSAEEQRPSVQIGDPFTEKCLMEAVLELTASGAVIGIQDMGAAGLTCSAVEMGDKGGLGVRLDLDKVPTREDGMSAFEMMLSESQERMLMALHPHREQIARDIFAKWGLDFAIVGETIEEDRFLVYHGGELQADLPLSALAGEAPEYDRPFVEPQPPAPLSEDDLPEYAGAVPVLRRLLADLNYCSRRWVYQQYDHTVMGDTMQSPGGDAAVVRVHGTDKALAFCTDVTPRYCFADPYEGGKQAVAEAWRNLSAVGARPLAISDCLNFGSPERPDIMGQFVYCLRGIAEACRALDMPIVSGNVSFYNETNGEAIMPTPTIAAVGLLQDGKKMLTMAAREEGECLLLLGESRGWLGASAYLRVMHQSKAGAPPRVDLQAEKRVGELVREAAERGLLTAAHDLADGGLALAAVEMALAGDIGLHLYGPDDLGLKSVSARGWFFGEDQARFCVACGEQEKQQLLQMAVDSGVACVQVGSFAGDMVEIDGEKMALAELRSLHESALPDFTDL